MTTRWILTVVLACSMAAAMTGCKSWWKSNNKTDGTGTSSSTDILRPVDQPIIGAGERPTDFGGTNVVAAGQFEAALFAFDSATVEDAERAKVEKVADFLKSNAGNVVVCEGNCDERGSTEYNMSLGERRAQAVRAYLMSLGGRCHPHPDQELRQGTPERSRPHRDLVAREPPRRLCRPEELAVDKSKKKSRGFPRLFFLW